MWYRSMALVVVCALYASQTSWAQPGGGGNRGANLGGGAPGKRDQDAAIRKLEREVAQLKAELKKLQSASTPSRGQRGGPGGFAQQDGRGRMGPPARFRGQAFQQQRGFGPQRFQSRGFQDRGFQARGFGDRFGPAGRGQQFRQMSDRGPGFRSDPPDYRRQRDQRPQQGFGPERRENARPPMQRTRPDALAERGTRERSNPSRSREGDARPAGERRPPRPE